jgi:hypothetical protein
MTLDETGIFTLTYELKTFIFHVFVRSKPCYSSDSSYP